MAGIPSNGHVFQESVISFSNSATTMEGTDNFYEESVQDSVREGDGQEDAGAEIGKEDHVNEDLSDVNNSGQEDHGDFMASLEARAAVKFHGITFWKELFYHTFFPLAVPVMFLLEGGWLSLLNRGFLDKNRPVLVFSQLSLAMCFYMVNIVSTVYVAKEHNYSFLFDVLLVDLLWIMRNMVVATKYAFLSKPEMKEMRTKFLSPTVHLNRTLLYGWKDPIPLRILKNELLLAAVRTRIMKQNVSFSLDNTVDSTEALRDMVLDLSVRSSGYKKGSLSVGKHADKWLEMGNEEFIRDQVVWAESGGVARTELPVRLYAAHAILQSSSLSRLRRLGHTLLSQHLRVCAFVLGLAHAIIPVAVRFMFGGHTVPGPAWTTFVIQIPSFVVIGFSMWSNVSFMMIGVLDFRRRHYMVQKLDELLRSSAYVGSQHVRQPSLTSSSSSFFHTLSSLTMNKRRGSVSSRSSNSSSSGALAGTGILVDFTDPESLHAWWIARQLMQNFGLGFHRRIKYYTTYFACYCAILLFFVALKVLTGIKRDDISLLVTVIFSIDVFLSLLALMVWPGGDVNHLLQVHGATLTGRKMKTQIKMIWNKLNMSDEELQRTSNALDTIASIGEAVRWDNAKSKLSVCGFEASDQLISLIVAAITASISIGIGQIVQNGASSG